MCYRPIVNVFLEWICISIRKQVMRVMKKLVHWTHKRCEESIAAARRDCQRSHYRLDDRRTDVDDGQLFADLVLQSNAASINPRGVLTVQRCNSDRRRVR